LTPFHAQLQKITGTTDSLSLILRGGDVVRYHTEGHALPRQTVAEHTWRMIAILLHLWPDASRELILAAHSHDKPEGVRGDPPACLGEDSIFIQNLDRDILSHLKCPNWRDLPNHDVARLKCADYLEALIFAGSHCYNRKTAAIVRRAHELVLNCITRLPTEAERIMVHDFLVQVLEEIGLDN
jgi:hypothetical protein